MSISARINVLDSTAKLEADRDAALKLLESDDIGPDFAEYLEAEVELIEDELDRRDDADSDPAVQGARQAEQDADEGIEMWSYGS